MVDSHTYRPRTESLLYMLSLARCANPECPNPLVIPLDAAAAVSEENAQINKQIAHIHSERAGGPRHVPGMSVEELRSYPNLILLCPQCHGMVDDFPERYPADTLRQWKEARKSEALDSFGRNTSLLAAVIGAISRDTSFDGDPGEGGPLVPFVIEEKISHNDLKENGPLIREYSMFQGRLIQLYRTLEQGGSFKKVALLRYIRKEYVTVKGVFLSKFGSEGDEPSIIRSHSDDIFSEVHLRLIETVRKEAGDLLSYEETAFGSLIVMVDAFMDCKILERPR